MAGGFDERGEHSPHLRLFVDRAGQVWTPRPEDLPAGPPAATQRRLMEIWAESEASGEVEEVSKSSHSACKEVLSKHDALLPSERGRMR